MFGGTRAGERYFHEVTRKFAGLIQIFDYRLGDDADEGIDDELCNNTFDA